MKTETSEEALKVFAIESFGSNKKILVSDVNLNNILDYLYMLDCWEISLTKSGAEYLIDSIGFDDVVKIILTEINKGVDYKNRTKETIEEWLKQETDNAGE